MIRRSDVFTHAERKFGVKPKYPFQKYPRYAILRHGDGADKWFALVMDVPRGRLGLDGEGSVDVLDIKASPQTVEALKSAPGFRPAYHMNKTHWLSVILDGTVPAKEVLRLLDESYALTA